MQQNWAQNRPSRRRRLEPYPDPIADLPPAWPEGLSPATSRASDNHPANGVPADGSGTGAASNMDLEGVYIISVAARLLEMHPQTLRKYERLGLIQPVRTVGMLRLYSREDLRKVMMIRHLMDNLGLNLAGVEFALKLVNNLDVFSRRLARSTGDPDVAAAIREEVSLLCSSLSLPAPE